MEKAALRKYITICVICGLACIALLGVTVIRDGQREWKDHQQEYQQTLLKKIKRESNPAFYDRLVGLKPEIRQVVLPEFKEIERCTTCHLGIDDPLFADAKQPLRMHPNPELMKKHPVEKFGCTICHGGQGQATTFYGSSHQVIPNWPVTLVAKGLMQSRCGYCHRDLDHIGADRLITGRQLYKEMHCAGCHKIDNQGGVVGPDLSAFADKDPGGFDYNYVTGGHSKQAWVIEHFKDPKKVSPGSPMYRPALSDYQIECLATYVLSLSQREFTRHYIAKVQADFVPPNLDEIVPEAEVE